MNLEESMRSYFLTKLLFNVTAFLFFPLALICSLSSLIKFVNPLCQQCVPLSTRLFVLDNNENRNEQCSDGPYCFSSRSLTVRPSCQRTLSVFHSCNFLLRLFFCVNYKALGKRRMWLRLSIKCSFQLRNPTPEIETLLWRGVRRGVGEGSIACSPLFPCPFPLAHGLSIDAVAAAVRFRFRFRFSFVRGREKGKQGGKGGKGGKGRGRELTYKSSNGHSLWFGLAASPLSGRRTCVNICAKCGCSLTDTKHSPSFWAVCVCVCVFGGQGAWSVHGFWFELGFSSNCSACCCWFSFGNLCSVCIVCHSVSLSHSERQAFSCLNLSCICGPWNKARENKISNRVHRGQRRIFIAILSFHSFFLTVSFLQISYWIFQLFPLAKSSTSLLLLNFRFYILVRLSSTSPFFFHSLFLSLCSHTLASSLS